MNQDANNFNQQGGNGMLDAQNQNMEQNNNVNQQPMFNSTQNNNVYQQPVSQNNIPNTNSTTDSQKQNKTKTIAIVLAVAVVVVVALFIGIMSFGKGGLSSSGGYTVNYGETLKISEINGYYDFDIDVLSIEKDYPVDNYLYDGNCFALRVNIKNDSTSDLSLLSFINFTLLDSSNNEVATLNKIMSSMIDGSIESEILSGKSSSGYLYFYNIDDDGYGSNIDDSDISKLKISVPKELDKSGDVITGNYNDYYINLK